MKPTVIVTSQGELTSIAIIKAILEANGATEENIEEVNCGTDTFLTHLCHIKTKYYENTIALLPVEAKDMVKLPADILTASEMLIVYFEPQNKSFLEQLPALSKFLEENSIELGILLTSKLYDDVNQGLTYEGLKAQCGFQFDIIELCDESQEDDEATQHEYNEVVEVLKNHVWANITTPADNVEQPDSLEEELESFEELITSIQNFKSASRNMERNEVINEAERLAELFVKMLNQD